MERLLRCAANLGPRKMQRGGVQWLGFALPSGSKVFPDQGLDAIDLALVLGPDGLPPLLVWPSSSGWAAPPVAAARSIFDLTGLIHGDGQRTSCRIAGLHVLTPPYSRFALPHIAPPPAAPGGCLSPNLPRHRYRALSGEETRPDPVTIKMNDNAPGMLGVSHDAADVRLIRMALGEPTVNFFPAFGSAYPAGAWCGWSKEVEVSYRVPALAPPDCPA